MTTLNDVVYEIYGKMIALPCFITENKWLAFQRFENIDMVSPNQYVLCRNDKWGFWKYNFIHGCFEIIRGKSLIKI